MTDGHFHNFIRMIGIDKKPRMAAEIHSTAILGKSLIHRLYS